MDGRGTPSLMLEAARGQDHRQTEAVPVTETTRDRQEAVPGPSAAGFGILMEITVAATGLLRSVSPGRYELTEAAQAVVDSWAMAGIRFNSDAEAWRALGEITETIRTGKPPFLARHGSVYDYLATRPEAAAAFDALMESHHAPVAAALSQVIDFGSMGTVVDVGGGYGVFWSLSLKSERALDAVDVRKGQPGIARRLADVSATRRRRRRICFR